MYQDIDMFISSSLLDLNPFPVIHITPDKATILQANSAAQKLLHLARQTENLTPVQAIDPDGVLRSQIQSSVEKQYPIRWQLSCGDKSRTLEAEPKPLLPKNGGGYLLNIRDITDIVHKEQELTRAVLRESSLRHSNEQALIQQAKMAQLGEMLSSIAHQWKQPLNSLGLLSQQMLIDPEFASVPMEVREQYVDSILHVVQFMSETIEDFRHFTKPERDIQQFNMKEALLDIVNISASQFRHHNIRLRFACSSHMQGDMQSFEVATDSGVRVTIPCHEECVYRHATINGYPGEFRQVVLVLLSNARDAILKARECGDLTPHEEGCISMSIHYGNDVMQLSVEDNAGGIPDSVMPYIFNRHFTTRKNGTGIGLHIAKTIIEDHMGGTIDVLNGTEGARFIISIPGLNL